jgi:hypothetical protein
VKIRAIRQLEELRDDCLVAVMQGLRAHRFGAGAVLADYERALFDSSHPRVMTDDDDLSRPLRLHSARVLPEWVDYNGHAHESRYLQAFGDASDALLRHLGIDAAYLADVPPRRHQRRSRAPRPARDPRPRRQARGRPHGPPQARARRPGHRHPRAALAPIAGRGLAPSLGTIPSDWNPPSDPLKA